VRPFVIDDELRASCRRLREHAEKTENWYCVGSSDWVPGNRSEHVIETAGGFRIVFSISCLPETPSAGFRHLSVSIPEAEGKCPHPLVLWTVAHLLGFTGAEVVDEVASAPGPWQFGLHETEDCVVVTEPLENRNVH